MALSSAILSMCRSPGVRVSSIRTFHRNLCLTSSCSQRLISPTKCSPNCNCRRFPSVLIPGCRSMSTAKKDTVSNYQRKQYFWVQSKHVRICLAEARTLIMRTQVQIWSWKSKIRAYLLKTWVSSKLASCVFMQGYAYFFFQLNLLPPYSLRSQGD